MREWLMTLHTSRIAVGSLVVALALGGCSERHDTLDRGAVDRTADEAAIRSILAANWAAGSARDAEGVAATYLPDGDVWIAGLSRISGNDQIRRAEEEFGSLPGFQRYDGRIESIRFISPDSAIVEVSATTTLESGKFDEDVTIVVARGEVNWRIAAWRVMTFDKRLLDLLSK
jgi:uncharacterized protein (TIGR02246 family)